MKSIMKTLGGSVTDVGRVSVENVGKAGSHHQHQLEMFRQDEQDVFTGTAIFSSKILDSGGGWMNLLANLA